MATPVPLVFSSIDYTLIAVAFALGLALWAWFPRARHTIESGVPGARMRLYTTIMCTSWAIAVAVLASWNWQGRSLSALGLGVGSPARMAGGFAILAAYLVLALLQRRAILARPELLKVVLAKLGSADAMFPRTQSERTAWIGISITAGITEEIFSRGFMLSFFSAIGGLTFGVIASSIVFGLDHAYLGWRHIIKSAIAGGVLAVVVVISGSLWPAILLHTAVDMMAGDLGSRAANYVPAAA